MKISSLGSPYFSQKKINGDEQIARSTLIEVWTQITEKYAHPGALVPSVEEVRKELVETGVEAAAKAVAKEHFYLFPFMIQGKIREKVEKGLSLFDLAEFIEDVKVAQANPELLQHLRDKIRHYVFSELY